MMYGNEVLQNGDKNGLHGSPHYFSCTTLPDGSLKHSKPFNRYITL